MNRLLPLLAALATLMLPATSDGLAPGAPPGEPAWVLARRLDSGLGIGLRWSPVTGASTYEIHRRTGEGKLSPLATVQGIQFVDGAVEAGGEYGYRIRSVGESGPGAFSEERVVRLPPAAVVHELFAPQWRGSLVEMIERTGRDPVYRVALSWRPVAGAAGYHLTRSRVGVPGFETIGTFAELDAVDASVLPGQTYIYVLAALDNRLEESPRSLELPIAVGPETARVIRRDRPSFPARLLWETGNVSPRAPAAAGKADLTDPADIAFDRVRDRIYVPSSRHRHVVMLRGADGLPISVIGPRLGKHELRLPLGVSVSDRGELVIVDQEATALYVVAPDGRLRRRIPIAAVKGMKPPRLIDAAFHGDGRLLVTDAANGRVLVLGPDGRRVAIWDISGSGEAGLGAIGSIDIAADGTVAVADAKACQIKLFTPRGKYLGALGSRGGADRGFAFLGGFASDVDGRFLAADLGDNRIKRLGPGLDGTVVIPIGSPAGELQLLGPLAVATDGAGRIFVAEGIANRVLCVQYTAGGDPR